MSKVDLDKLNKLAGLAIIHDGLDVYTFRDACTPETIIDLIRELRAARKVVEAARSLIYMPNQDHPTIHCSCGCVLCGENSEAYDRAMQKIDSCLKELQTEK